jgi:hypothetical protein
MVIDQVTVEPLTVWLRARDINGLPEKVCGLAN